MVDVECVEKDARSQCSRNAKVVALEDTVVFEPKPGSVQIEQVRQADSQSACTFMGVVVKCHPIGTQAELMDRVANVLEERR